MNPISGDFLEQLPGDAGMSTVGQVANEPKVPKMLKTVPVGNAHFQSPRVAHEARKVQYIPSSPQPKKKISFSLVDFPRQQTSACLATGWGVLDRGRKEVDLNCLKRSPGSTDHV